MRNLIVACVLGLSLFCSSAFAAVVITPTIRYNQPTIGGYLVGGSYVISQNTTTGIAGDIIGAASGALGTTADTAAAICGSASRILVDVIFSAAGSTAANSGFVVVFDNSVANAPRAIVNAVLVGAATAPLTSTATAVPAGVVGRFIAICK